MYEREPEHVEFEFWYKDELYSASAFVYCSIDNNYGADADGNRGIVASFIDHIEVDELSMIDEDGEFADIPSDLYSEVLQVAEDKAVEYV